MQQRRIPPPHHRDSLWWKSIRRWALNRLLFFLFWIVYQNPRKMEKEVNGWLSVLNSWTLSRRNQSGYLIYRGSWLKFTVKKEGKEEQIYQQGSAKAPPNSLFRLLSNTLLDHFQFSFSISGKSSKSVSIRSTQSKWKGCGYFLIHQRTLTSPIASPPLMSPVLELPFWVLIFLLFHLYFRKRVNFSGRKVPHTQALCQWEEGRAREVHNELKSVWYLSLAISSTML